MWALLSAAIVGLAVVGVEASASVPIEERFSAQPRLRPANDILIDDAADKPDRALSGGDLARLFDGDDIFHVAIDTRGIVAGCQYGFVREATRRRVHGLLPQIYRSDEFVTDLAQDSRSLAEVPYHIGDAQSVTPVATIHGTINHGRAQNSILDGLQSDLNKEVSAFGAHQRVCGDLSGFRRPATNLSRHTASTARARIGRKATSLACVAARLATITISPARTCSASLRKQHEDNRRVPNGEQVQRVAKLALGRKKSVDFTGYWQRHVPGESK